MFKKKFNLRKVAAIVACLAVMAMFCSCDDDENGDGDYTISYRPGTHSSGQNHSQSKNFGEDVTLRDATYTRNGFTQTGWSIDKDGSYRDFKLNETYADDANITLFPFWTAGDGNFTIEYRPGLFSSGQTYTQVKKAGVDIMLRDTTYTRAGFRHVGWSRDENGDDWNFYFDTEYWDDENIILYPHWRYPNPHYKLPTNVRAEYVVEESSGIGNMRVTAIKIGKDYFSSSVSALFGGSLIRERFFKYEGGRWHDYERYVSDGEASPWRNTTNSSNEAKWAEGFVFGGMVSEDVIFEARTRLPVGKETIVGVECDKYVITQSYVQTWRYTFLFDPVYALNFHVGLTVDDAARSKFEVKVWDTSVTDFGDIVLP